MPLDYRNHVSLPSRFLPDFLKTFLFFSLALYCGRRLYEVFRPQCISLPSCVKLFMNGILFYWIRNDRQNLNCTLISGYNDHWLLCQLTCFNNILKSKNCFFYIYNFLLVPQVIAKRLYNIKIWLNKYFLMILGFTIFQILVFSVLYRVPNWCYNQRVEQIKKKILKY